MKKTAILVDGAFYRKRAFYLRGDKSPIDRANELYAYCMAHIRDEGKDSNHREERELYRIFYKDGPGPEEKLCAYYRYIVKQNR